MKTLTQLKRKAKHLGSSEHKESFEKVGFCIIPGCKCHQRKPMSYMRIGKIVPSTSEPTADEIKAFHRKLKRKERMRKELIENGQINPAKESTQRG